MQQNGTRIERSSQFLMANLGSEVARLYASKDANNGERMAASSTRALHIVSELSAHPELQGRTGEIDILRDILTDAISTAPIYDVTRKDLEAYFMPFALRTLPTV